MHYPCCRIQTLSRTLAPTLHTPRSDDHVTWEVPSEYSPNYAPAHCASPNCAYPHYASPHWASPHGDDQASSHIDLRLKAARSQAPRA